MAAHVGDKAVLNLIGQDLRRTAERGGQFFDYDRGISLGCPLSPLIGAFFLDDLDRRMAKTGLFYVRFVDDVLVLVLAPTCWKLRRAVRMVNQVLGALGLEKHPDKIFIGRIERGFNFLGCHFSRSGLRVAKGTLEKFVERASRLYEREPGDASGTSRFGAYVRRWAGWATGGLTHEPYPTYPVTHVPPRDEVNACRRMRTSRSAPEAV